MTDDLWAGTDALDAATNPFDPNDAPEMHAAWNRAQEESAAADAAATAQLRHAADVRQELARLRARRDAAAQMAAEDAKQVTVAPPTPLPDLLAEPDMPTVYRIDRVWPAGGNVVLAAAYKAGKTTAIGNLLRSLADGEPFLDVFTVAPLDPGTRVGIVDFEMPRDRLRAWLRDQDIKQADRVSAWTLRGQAATFNILDPGIRGLWAARLAEHLIRVLVIDCLGPILSALGRDEDNKGVGPLLDALSSLAHDAGLTELALVHHMGHVAERARGASRLRDWPDAEWRIVRQRDPDNPAAEPPPNAPRFFAAFGRDVEVGEGQLAYDQGGRRLTYIEGTRREARTANATRAVLDLVHRHPGRSGRAVEAAVVADPTTGLGRNQVREALDAAVATGLLTTTVGARRAKLHHLSAAGARRLDELNGGGHTPPPPTPLTPEPPPWVMEEAPNVEPELVQCPRCYAPHDGPTGTNCPRCGEEK